MRYRINWTERVGYYTYIDADSHEEAMEKWREHEFDSCEPDSFCEHEEGSEEATEDPE